MEMKDINELNYVIGLELLGITKRTLNLSFKKFLSVFEWKIQNPLMLELKKDTS